MNTLSIIDERVLFDRKFTVYGTLEKPLFLARDVAEWIEYDKNSVNKLLEGVDEDEKLNGTIFRAGQNREVAMLTEEGLYEVLMMSRKPIAREFKKKVKAILKEIRITGALKQSPFGEMIPRNYREALLLAANQQEQIERLELKTQEQVVVIEEQTTRLEEQSDKIEKQLAEIKRMTPYSEYCSKVLLSDDLTLITEIAKDYGMSGSAMNKKLNEIGVHYKIGNSWCLYQKWAKYGFTKTKTIPVERNGKTIFPMQTAYTQKGRLFLYVALKRHGILPLIEQKNDSDDLEKEILMIVNGKPRGRKKRVS